MKTIYSRLPSWSGVKGMSLLAVGWILFSCANTQTPGRSFSFEKQIGVASVSDDQNSCMAIYNPDIPSGATVTLINQALVKSEEMSDIKEAPITEKLTNRCDNHWDNGDRDGAGLTFYRLKPTSEPWRGGGNVFVVLDPAKPITLRDHMIDADLDGDGTKESFRVCASNEGVHFQVWTGEPLVGTPRFHWYYYAGYDTEYTCTEREYFGPK
jgi:hypothetical protein